MKVQFKILTIEDTRKQGSEINTYGVFEGELIEAKVFYTDKTGTEWIFYPGDTCILEPISQLDTTIHTVTKDNKIEFKGTQLEVFNYLNSFIKFTKPNHTVTFEFNPLKAIVKSPSGEETYITDINPDPSTHALYVDHNLIARGPQSYVETLANYINVPSLIVKVM